MVLHPDQGFSLLGVTIIGKGLQNLGLCSTLIAYES
jgi:hypothetical protein